MTTTGSIGNAAWAFGAAMLLLASTSFAHTTIRSQMTEGTSDDNALKISHTCTTPDGDKVPVVAQSVVFPTLAPEISTSDGSTINDLSEVIQQGSLAGLGKAIQDKSIFRSQAIKLDDLGNQIGFSAVGGALNPDTPGRVPFQYTPPNFVPTSCAKRLLIKIAIADICIPGFSITDSVQLGKVNLWIPDNGSQWGTLLAGYDGVGAPATLTINRNTATNPLPSGCGAGIDVTVNPSPADMDAHLPIPGYWP